LVILVSAELTFALVKFDMLIPVGFMLNDILLLSCAIDE